MAWDDSFFRGKKITLIGLGLLGRGVGDAVFLAECGAELIVTDGKSAEELAPSVARLAPFPQITLHLGGHQMEDFRDRDMILRGPAVRPDSPFLREAESHGIPIEMDASLFARLSPTKRIIGTTNTLAAIKK
jgi:UDP-N-acetylmuramoylalanine--D-glutamate ligase